MTEKVLVITNRPSGVLCHDIIEGYFGAQNVDVFGRGGQGGRLYGAGGRRSASLPLEGYDVVVLHADGWGVDFLDYDALREYAREHEVVMGLEEYVALTNARLCPPDRLTYVHRTHPEERFFCRIVRNVNSIPRSYRLDISLLDQKLQKTIYDADGRTVSSEYVKSEPHNGILEVCFDLSPGELAVLRKDPRDDFPLRALMVEDGDEVLKSGQEGVLLQLGERGHRATFEILNRLNVAAAGTVRLEIPGGFSVAPEEAAFELEGRKGEDERLTFRVDANPEVACGAYDLILTVACNGRTLRRPLPIQVEKA